MFVSLAMSPSVMWKAVGFLNDAAFSRVDSFLGERMLNMQREHWPPCELSFWVYLLFMHIFLSPTKRPSVSGTLFFAALLASNFSSGYLSAWLAGCLVPPAALFSCVGHASSPKTQKCSTATLALWVGSSHFSFVSGISTLCVGPSFLLCM